jgi:hypothetical protein
MNNRRSDIEATALALTGSNQTISGQLVFLGISASDEGSGSIKIHVYHGTSDTDPHLAGIAAQSGGSDTLWFGPNGISCPNGIYVKVYSGSPEGSVFLKGTVV